MHDHAESATVYRTFETHLPLIRTRFLGRGNIADALWSKTGKLLWWKEYLSQP